MAWRSEPAPLSFRFVTVRLDTLLFWAACTINGAPNLIDTVVKANTNSTPR